MEVWAVFRATHRPSQPPPSLSSGNHREVIILEQMQRLKKEGMMEKKHCTKPPHVSNEYTPQLLNLFCIFYIFTYTKYFQTSLCLFKTPSVTHLAEQIQCKQIHRVTLPHIGFKMHQVSKPVSTEVNNSSKSQNPKGRRLKSIILNCSPYSKDLQPTSLKMNEAMLLKQRQLVHQRTGFFAHMSQMPVACGWVVGVGWNGNKTFEGRAEQPSSDSVEKSKNLLKIRKSCLASHIGKIQLKKGRVTPMSTFTLMISSGKIN